MPDLMPDLVTTADVVARLGVDPRTVHRMVERGVLPAAGKLPGLRGAYLFRAADVDAYIAAKVSA